MPTEEQAAITTTADQPVAVEQATESPDDPYAFYNRIGRPKYIVAPMVD